MYEGLLFLAASGWVRFPGGVPPSPSALEDAVTWARYEWNPDADPEASAKPAWQEIESAAEQAEQAARFRRFRHQARAEASRRICAVYGARDPLHEVQIRLREEETLRQRLERDEIRLRYRRLMESESPLTEAFDPAMLDES